MIFFEEILKKLSQKIELINYQKLRRYSNFYTGGLHKRSTLGNKERGIGCDVPYDFEKCYKFYIICRFT